MTMRSLAAATLALPLVVAGARRVSVSSNNNSNERLRRRRLKKFVAKVKFTEHEVDDIWNEVDLDTIAKAKPDDVPPVDLSEEENDFVCESAGSYCENKHLCNKYTRLHESTMLLSDASKMDCFCMHAWSYEDAYCDEITGFDPVNCACEDGEENDLARDDVELNDPDRTQRDMVVACVRYSLDEGDYEWITESIAKREYTKLVLSDEDSVLPDACAKHFEDCDPSGVVCAEKADLHRPDDEANEDAEDEDIDDEEVDAEMGDEIAEEEEDAFPLGKEIEMEERLSAEISELGAKIKQIETLLDEDQKR